MTCPACGSRRLAWGQMSSTTRGSRNIAPGRLRTGEVETVFFLGCEECSETVRTVRPDDIVDLLNAGLALLTGKVT